MNADKKVMLMLIILFVCGGCASNGAGATDESEPQYIEVNLNESYYLVEREEGFELAGIAAYGENIVACNAGMNGLTIFSDTDTEPGTFGSIGNGIDEFIQPTGVDIANEAIYVLDAGNNRVQIYDMDLNYTASIALDLLDTTSEVYYTDISVSEDGYIYVTTNSTDEDTAQIYIIDKDGNVKTSTVPIYGYTYCDGNTAYGMNTFELSQTKDAMTASFGHSYLYSIGEEGTLTQQAELPYKYGPTDFVVEGDDLYVLSSGWARLDHFRTDGTYLETLYQFDELYPESYLTRTSNGFAVTDRYANTTYILSDE